MDITITPQALHGRINSIASKSQAHRLLLCGALSGEAVTVLCSESSEDIDATARCLSALCARTERTPDGFKVSPMQAADTPCLLDCGESGSTLRFLLPVVGALGKQAKFLLSGRLGQRPLSPLWEQLCAHGMTLSREGENGILCGGQLRGGAFTLPGDVSSQFISGLLFALPLLAADSTLTLTGKIESVRYIAMTEAALRQSGIRFTYADGTYKIPGRQKPAFLEKERLQVEGDWSNAAFWLVAGAIGEGITVLGLDTHSLQGDKAIIELLPRFGATVQHEENGITAKKAPMKGIEIDGAQIPDLVPILAVLATAAEGTTRIYGAERLRIKESDRLKTVSAMLTRLGGDITETADGLIVQGKPLCGGTVDSAGDHRIAMAAAVASILCKEAVTIQGAEAVNKSYPGFWEHFTLLGGQIERKERV
ncbi:MAG: 3-phosphoshikimate 1-carboxyvinyltransferase [Ruminococcaceae bacterium]|nr:3-phosphoshikimate 1-carboxyvinyltransferase [Oscillospiraceae bacterium]